MKGMRINSNNNRTARFTIEYINKLQALNDYRIDAYIRLIDSFHYEIKQVSKQIPAVSAKEDIARLLVHSDAWYSNLHLFCSSSSNK